MNKVFIGALVAVILILFWWGGCGHMRANRAEKKVAQLEGKPAPKPQKEIDTVTTEVVVKVPVYVPVPTYRDTGSTRYLPGQPYAVPGPIRYVDSSRSAWTWTAYADSLAIPLDGGHLRLYDTVAGNTIVSRRADWHLKQRTITEKTTVLERRRQLWVGIGGGYAMRDSIMSVGPSLMYLTKRGMAYEAGVHADTKGKLMFSAGAKFLISLRKK